MVAVCRLFLLLLMIQLQSFKGDSATIDLDVFSVSGENVNMSCRNSLPGCYSTTWIYSNNTCDATVELINLGEKKDVERKERLSLAPDCSLVITKVTPGDQGSYTCQQFVNHIHQRNDARVYLHILDVTPSQSEIRAGDSLTLSCRIIAGSSCDYVSGGNKHKLIWVNQADENLTDSRYQISVGNCITNLTIKLQNEDENTEIKCRISPGRNTSVSYRVKHAASGRQTHGVMRVVYVAIGMLVAMIAAVLLGYFIIRHGKMTKRNVVSGYSQHDETLKHVYETVDTTITPAPQSIENREDVTYSVVTATSNQLVKARPDYSGDHVTYEVLK